LAGDRDQLGARCKRMTPPTDREQTVAARRRT